MIYYWEWGVSVTFWYSVAVLDLRWNPMEIIKVCILSFVWFCDSELLLTSKTVEGLQTVPMFSDYLHCGTRIKLTKRQNVSPKWRPKWLSWKRPSSSSLILTLWIGIPCLNPCSALAVPPGEAGGHSALHRVLHLRADAAARRCGQEQQPAHPGELASLF